MVALKYENVVFPDKVGFKCRTCGSCCRQKPGDANSEEQRRIEGKGFTNFLDPPSVTGLRFIRRNSHGECFFLTNDNKCAIYDVRPMVCRMAPFTVTDWDYENNVIYVDLSTVAFECRGIFDGTEIPFQVIAKAAQDYVQEKLERTARIYDLSVTSRQASHFTRKFIIEDLTPFTF